MRRMACLFLLVAGTALSAAEWHHPLYLGNGELWRQRVPLTVRNNGDQAVQGVPVSLRVGTGPGEVPLVGTAAEALRVCTAAGVEFLFALRGPNGGDLTRGPVPAGAELVVPADCPAKGTAGLFVYADNPAAWQVPDFLAGAGGLVNGGLEDGEGDTPAGWKHDANDGAHRTAWVAETPHAGGKCLKTTVTDGAEPTWIATRQVGIRINGGARYVMTAWVRAENVKGYAGWYIHLGNRANPMVTSPMLEAGDGTFGWKQVRAEFTAPAEANLSDLGTVLRGTGTAWFDDIELTCLDPAQLTVTAGAAERLQVRETGAGAAWYEAAAAPARNHRVPLRVANLTATARGQGLVSADLTATLAQFHRRLDPESLLLVADGQPAPLYRLSDTLLFEGEAAANTVRTVYLYFATRQAPSAAATAPAAGPLAANPALPGASEASRGPATMLRRDYAALLASPRNLVQNADFETGTDLPEAWPGGAEGERPAGTEMGLSEGGLFGRRCARMHVPATATPAWTGWRQRVPVRPGATYLYAAWLKTDSVQPNVQLHAHFRNAAGELCRDQQHTGAGPAISGTQDWTLISGLFTMPDDIAFFELHLTMLATGTVWHEGAVLAEVTPGEAGRIESRLAPTATQGPRALAAWPVNAVEKVFREDLPPSPVPPARISAAGNDREPLQLAVRSAAACPGVRVVVEAAVGPGGARLDRSTVGVVGYVPMDHKTNYYSSKTPEWHRKFPTSPGACDGWPGWWPDPILPRDTLDLAAETTQPVWITLAVPADAPTGDYTGRVRLLRGAQELAAVPFTVHVWGFSLPAESHVKAIYDCRQGSPHWDRPDTTREERLVQAWRFMAERRTCPDSLAASPNLRYDPATGQATADFTEYDRMGAIYFDELKLPHSYTPWDFYEFGWGHLPASKFGQAPYEGAYPHTGVDRAVLRPEYKRAYQACLKLFWDHLKAKGWASRVVLYISDEPFDAQPEIRAQMSALCDMIHEVDPAIRIYCSTWHEQPAWEGKLDVWGVGHYGIVSEAKLRDLRAKGATIWWTTDGQMCTDTPFCAIERLLPHYCFKYGAEAYEFWGVDWLTFNPFEFGWHGYLIHDFGPDKEKEYVRYPNGDGFLMYPGPLVGHPGPVTSLRLEQAREGVEDYEFLYRLRELVGTAKAAGRDVAAGEAALARAAALVAMPCPSGRYSTQILPDPDALYAARAAVAEAIEGLSKR